MAKDAEMDVHGQIQYWRNGSAEEIEVAQELLAKGRIRHALFLAHLALEKMLKAHVTRKTADVPPRIHNLGRLAELTGLSIPAERRSFLDRFDVYQMEGRCPEELKTIPISLPDAQRLLSSVKETLEWLTEQF